MKASRKKRQSIHWIRAVLLPLLVALCVIGLVGLAHMGEHQEVSRAWPPYMTGFGFLGLMAYLAEYAGKKPARRRQRAR